MKKRFWLFRTPVLIGVLVLGIGLVSLHLRYPLPYIYRVMVYQDADFSDIYEFPASSIAPAGTSSELVVERDPRVTEIIEQHPDIDSFERFLDETETTAFLVVHEDRLVEERYLMGHTRDSLQNTFSISKSVTSALIGLAQHERSLDVDAPITEYLPELNARDERFAGITVEHLLDMRSGIRYTSGVGFPFVNADDALIYYYPDLEAIALERTTVARPPGSFQYNNYNPSLLGLIVRRATGISASKYLERKLWQPLGAEHEAGWTVDDHGMERMESGFHATARDLARFGMVYLNRGVVEGSSIVPEAWVRESTDLREPPQLDVYNGRSWAYRAGWWIVPRPEPPSDFSAIGRYGQFIYISPQYNVVFVRNGPGRGEWGDYDWTELFYSVAARL